MPRRNPFRKRAYRGHCIWPGCPERGVYFTGRTVGLEKKWGYACPYHEHVIANKNLDRDEEEQFWRGQGALAERKGHDDREGD